MDEKSELLKYIREEDFGTSECGRLITSLSNRLPKYELLTPQYPHFTSIKDYEDLVRLVGSVRGLLDSEQLKFRPFIRGWNSINFEFFDHRGSMKPFFEKFNAGPNLLLAFAGSKLASFGGGTDFDFEYLPEPDYKASISLDFAERAVQTLFFDDIFKNKIFLLPRSKISFTIGSALALCGAFVTVGYGYLSPYRVERLCGYSTVTGGRFSHLIKSKKEPFDSSTIRACKAIMGV